MLDLILQQDQEMVSNEDGGPKMVRVCERVCFLEGYTAQPGNPKRTKLGHGIRRARFLSSYIPSAWQPLGRETTAGGPRLECIVDFQATALVQDPVGNTRAQASWARRYRATDEESNGMRRCPRGRVRGQWIVLPVSGQLGMLLVSSLTWAVVDPNEG